MATPLPALKTRGGPTEAGGHRQGAGAMMASKSVGETVMTDHVRRCWLNMDKSANGPMRAWVGRSPLQGAGTECGPRCPPGLRSALPVGLSARGFSSSRISAGGGSLDAEESFSARQ